MSAFSRCLSLARRLVVDLTDSAVVRAGPGPGTGIESVWTAAGRR